jgi:catechol 2,3-dioxygenase-like lactoylglutathione lyase family enzyme
LPSRRLNLAALEAKNLADGRAFDPEWRAAKTKRARAGQARRSPYVSAMETNLIHRGRLIDHVQLVVADVERSKRFYQAVLGVLGVPLGGEAADYFWFDELFVSSAQSKAAAGSVTGRTHLAFQAADREQVERFHRAGLAAGGKEHGAPGERPYHPGYYAAFLLDPDGNNIEAVFHGEAKRSAPSIKIEF